MTRLLVSASLDVARLAIQDSLDRRQRNRHRRSTCLAALHLARKPERIPDAIGPAPSMMRMQTLAIDITLGPTGFRFDASDRDAVLVSVSMQERRQDDLDCDSWTAEFLRTA